MSFIRTFVFTVAKCRWTAMRQCPLVGMQQNPVVGFVACRFVSTQDVTKNIQVICQDDTPPSLEKPFTAENPIDRPLLILLEWLLANQKHVMKYANLYLDQGFDIVRVSLSQSQVLQPANGSRVVAKDLLTFLHLNTGYQRTIIHGFSAGAYIWGELLQHVYADSEKYNHVIDKIVGQVWDSIILPPEAHIAISKTVFPKNKILQTLMQNYMEFHLNMFHKKIMQYYIRSCEYFHTKPVQSPALFIASNTDPIGRVSGSINAQDIWNSLGVPSYIKIFDNSPHIQHFRMYPKEYANEINAFLDKLNLRRNDKNNSSSSVNAIYTH